MKKNFLCLFFEDFNWKRKVVFLLDLKMFVVGLSLCNY